MINDVHRDEGNVANLNARHAQKCSNMNKEHILAEICRTATENGGAALGQERFETETEIKISDWYGKYWVRWSDAIKEAGLTPNRFTTAYSNEHLIANLAALTKELGHFPVVGEIKMKARQDKTFPSHSTFERFDGKRDIATRVRDWCLTHDDESTADLCTAVLSTSTENVDDENPGISTLLNPVGYVYLVQHGSRREYKIGRTNNTLRREGELRTELPEKLEPIHKIETDDPAGIESYWHRRFADKRKNGEWFALSADDVRAFKQWRRIY